MCLARSHYIAKGEAGVKRNRNMFGNIMGYLMKAKETLDSEKPKVGLG